MIFVFEVMDGNYFCSQSAIQWMRKNCPGFVWGCITKAIEPQEDMMVCLEPKDSFAVIVGSEEVTSHNLIKYNILYHW